MVDEIIKQLNQVKEASRHLIQFDALKRQQVLLCLADKIRHASTQIINENKKDLSRMAKEDPRYDRLELTSERINALAADVELVASLPCPLARIIEEKTMANGLRIQKIAVPLGVVAVIYESRPNVTIDVFALCIKSGNACVLKGGKEAQNSNRILVKLIAEALQACEIDPNCIYLLPNEREAMTTLLSATKLIDVCIPRGSQNLIDFVRANAKIPVIETGAGIVHAYFDESGDVEKGRLIINNAKTRRVSVCNALDTLVIHKNRLMDLHHLVEKLAEKNVDIFADETSYHALKTAYPQSLLHQAKASDFGCEFLAYKMAIKTVNSVEEAILHIRHYTSGHSEAIIAEDQKAITCFLAQIDAAVVYVNASTAFTDGGQFGMGAEIGISTQKLHARGPMALEALTSYQWVVWGSGQIRT